jgi:hypothetical protein
VRAQPPPHGGEGDGTIPGDEERSERNIGASYEVMVHHLKQHEAVCPSGLAYNVPCPCGRCHVIVCAECGEPLGVGQVAGPSCVHALGLGVKA